MLQGIPKGSGMLQGALGCSKGHWGSPKDSKGLRECSKGFQRAQGILQRSQGSSKGHWDAPKDSKGLRECSKGLSTPLPAVSQFPQVPPQPHPVLGGSQILQDTKNPTRNGFPPAGARTGIVPLPALGTTQIKGIRGILQVFHPFYINPNRRQLRPRGKTPNPNPGMSRNRKNPPQNRIEPPKATLETPKFGEKQREKEEQRTKGRGGRRGLGFPGWERLGAHGREIKHKTRRFHYLRKLRRV